MAKQDKSSSNLIWLLLLPLLIGFFVFNNNLQNKNAEKHINKVSVKKIKPKNTKVILKSKPQEKIIKVAVKPSPVIKPTKAVIKKTPTKSNTKKPAAVNSTPRPVAPKKKTSSINEKKTLVTLTIDKGNSPMVYNVSSSSMKTVLDVLTIASSKYNFSLEYKNYSYGAFIEEIDGLRNDKNNAIYWLYYINDKLATLGASSQKIKEGDKILWKYEKEK